MKGLPKCFSYFLSLHRPVNKTEVSFPTARDIYDIDTDHANIINDVKVNYAEQEILFKKIKNRNVSSSTRNPLE